MCVNIKIHKVMSIKSPYYNMLFILILVACNPIKNNDLEGFWLADRVEEAGERMDIDLSDLGFEFKGKNHYIYYNTEFLSEEGIYELKGYTLITTDTSGNNPLRKAVEILLLTNDSLHLRMNAGGKEQILYLYRMKDGAEDSDIEYSEDLEESTLDTLEN
jgi:hypothetical protein